MAEQDTTVGVTNLRLSNLEGDLAKNEATVAILREQISHLNETVARLSERLTLFQIFQATLSSILAAIAAVIARL